MSTLISEKILINNQFAPEIQGLTFRHFQGEKDYQIMLDIVESCREADQLEWKDNVEDIAVNYEHLDNCDPYKDMIFAEVDGEPIGYSRGWWFEELNKDRLYTHFIWLNPDWREKGIGIAIIQYMEDHLRLIADEHPEENRKMFQTWSSDKQQDTNRILDELGYEIVRYGYEMVRPTDASIPDAPMPDGLEVRTVKSDHIDAIWNATIEAFRDHWGYVPPTENDKQRWQKDKTFQPNIWMVGWNGDEVAGMVLNFINEEENKTLNRLRGYTENISVRRAWRRCGLARALLVQSIQMFKEMGMEETCLGVDTDNPTGALNLYKSVGYEPISTGYTFRKSFEVDNI